MEAGEQFEGISTVLFSISGGKTIQFPADQRRKVHEDQKNTKRMSYPDLYSRNRSYGMREDRYEVGYNEKSGYQNRK